MVRMGRRRVVTCDGCYENFFYGCPGQSLGARRRPKKPKLPDEPDDPTRGYVSHRVAGVGVVPGAPILSKNANRDHELLYSMIVS